MVATTLYYPEDYDQIAERDDINCKLIVNEDGTLRAATDQEIKDNDQE